MGLESVSRYSLLVGKPLIQRNVVVEKNPCYFAGISSNGDGFKAVICHAETISDNNIFLKTDSEFISHKNLISSKNFLNLYLTKNLKIRIRSGLSKQDFLLDYFHKRGIYPELISMDQKWQDDLGSVSRFFNIKYETIIPVDFYDTFLLALSSIVENIMKVGKNTLIIDPDRV
jgi:hypothetical protein